MITIPGYTIEKKIFETRDRVYFRGICDADNSHVLIKSHVARPPNPKDRAQITHEFELLRNLNIVGIIQPIVIKNYLDGIALVSKDLQAESLAERIKLEKFDLHLFLSIAISLSDTLFQLHLKNIIHKDIQPKNIFINLDTYSTEIVDFSIATVLPRESPKFTNPDSMEGSLSYMSPEQSGRMNRSLDYRTDFYSLGIVFYEMLTGRLPFQSSDPLDLLHSHLARKLQPPCEIDPEIPETISNIIVKLTEKTAEARYQNAQGLKSDLEECRRQLLQSGKVRPFKVGGKDISDKFQLSQKLYGREYEIDILLRPFATVVKGKSQMIMVSGYAGIGKTSLVQEIYKPITQKKGYFISGKFEQFHKNTPYSALVQAFKNLLHQILTEGESQLNCWKDRLLDTLGSNGQIIIDLIPEVELIIGPQPPVTVLEPEELQNRFNRLLLKFLTVFCLPGHALVLFLDDLQWVDTATLKFLDQLLNDEDLNHFYLIGAYRENEVDAGHPLYMTIDRSLQGKRWFRQINVSNLRIESISQLIADSLHCNLEKTIPLSRLVYEKTNGNPFFIKQFLMALNKKKLLRFNHGKKSWEWNLTKIESNKITDNVVDLLIQKVKQMPPETRLLLRMAACIGRSFDLKMLGLISGSIPAEILKNLLPAIREDLIVSSSGFRLPGELESNDPKLIETLKFQHDRIQQAAYALIDNTERKWIHYNIGKILLETHESPQQDEHIFDILKHMNFGVDNIDRQDIRLKVLDLNITAGRKAIGSAAYKHALQYYQKGIELLPADGWQSQYRRSLILYTEGLDAAALSGEFTVLERLFETAREQIKKPLDIVDIYRSRIRACMAQNKLAKATRTTGEILSMLGHPLPENPKESDIMASISATLSKIKNKQIDELINLPEMKDPINLAIIKILTTATAPVYVFAPKLWPLTICKMTALSIQFGISDYSAFSFCAYGAILCGFVGDIDSGYKFGELAIALLKRYDAKELEAKVCHVCNGLIFHWKIHVRDTLEPSLSGYHQGIESGDFEFAAINLYCYSKHSFLIGRNLDETETELSLYGKVLKKIRQNTPLNFLQIFQQSMQNLQGKSEHPHVLSGEVYDEHTMLPVHRQAKDRLAIFYLHLCKVILCYLFEEIDEAVKNAELAERELEAAPSLLGFAVFHFYESLVLLAVYPNSSIKGREHIIEKVAANQKKIKDWAGYAPMNYLHKFHLIEAERCRVLGRDMKAVDHYDQAIKLAREYKYLNEEALANELFSKFWLINSKRELSSFYMKKACLCYSLWGAKQKVEHLYDSYPQLLSKLKDVRGEHHVSSIKSNESLTSLDLSTIMKATQAISSQIELNDLLKTLTRIVIENAGANRGTLILEFDGRFLIVAQGEADGSQIELQPFVPLEKGSNISPAIINYVARTRQYTVVNNPAENGIFVNDPYIQLEKPLSVLCAPIIHKSKVMGVLYLENQFMSHVFSSGRVDVIKIMASQIAISIENARLFNECRRAEVKYRSMFENAVEGIYQTTLEGRFISANPAMARMLGYGSPEILMEEVKDIGRQLYVSQDARQNFLRMIKEGEIVTGLEVQFYHKDGSKIWASLHARPVYDETGTLSFVEGFFTDITERKLETEALLKREELLRKENILLKSDIKDRYKLGEIIGKSPSMQLVYELILKAAATEANVIVYGESGTGKELVARAIHNMSERKNKPFIPVNCGAIPENLFESEFFGYKKGSFTGAIMDKVGLLDRADTGTLFLDELGEMDQNIQIKLLRVLEGYGFTPIGGQEIRNPNVRIVAATNRDLQGDVDKGLIREDFFYRIHIIPIQLPPLRDRKEDIPLLIDHFLNAYVENQDQPPVTGKIMEALLSHHWPGNVRELQNVLHRHLTLNNIDFSTLTGKHGSDIEDPVKNADTYPSDNFKKSIESLEKKLILQALQNNQWHRGKAALSLGIPRRTFFRKLEKLSIRGH